MNEETHLFLEFDYPLGNEFLEMTPFLIGVGNTNGMGQKSLVQYLKHHETMQGVHLFQLKIGQFGMPFLASSQLVPTKQAFTNITGKLYWDGQEEESLLDHKRKIEFERVALMEKLKSHLHLIDDDEKRFRVQFSINFHEKMLEEELAATEPVKHAIYSTIYIRFNRRLEKEEIQFIQNRAVQYIEENDFPCELKQIRIERVTVEEEALVPSLGFVKEAILPTDRQYFGLSEEIIETEIPEDLMEFDLFIKSLELGLIKDSGFKIEAICSEGGVVYKDTLNPSDILFNKKYLIDYQNNKGKIKLQVTPK